LTPRAGGIGGFLPYPWREKVSVLRRSPDMAGFYQITLARHRIPDQNMKDRRKFLVTAKGVISGGATS
jgi:hypothetical protein